MQYIYLGCAIAGGTFLLIQMVMMLVGLGDGDLDFDTDTDFDGDFHGGAGDSSAGGHSDSWFVGVLSIRTLTAAVTFFGLAGLTSLKNFDAGETPSALAAIVAGFGALYGTYWVMKSLMRLQQDGTVRIERSVGKHGTVYIPIPGNHDGAGKIQLSLQGRYVEYQAVTPSPEKLPTGAKIVVVSVVSGDTVEVEPLLETVEV